MKALTRKDYLQRIDRVVALLQAAVEQGGELPELARLAAIAHLSPFHFHRIYQARLRLLRDELPFRHFLDDPEDVPEAIRRADIYLPVAPC